MKPDKDRPAEKPAGYDARELALDLVDSVVHKRQPLDALQGKINDIPLSREDRAFAMMLTLTTLRHYGALKSLVLAKMEKPLPDAAQRGEAILVLGLAQLLLLETPPHAAVDMSVELAKSRSFTRSFAPLINAVLRRLSEERDLKIDPALVLPAWLMQRWKKAYGESIALAMARAQLQQPPLDLSVKEDPALWAQKLQGERLPTGTVRLGSHKGLIENLAGFEEGAWWVQDASARLPVLLMGDVKDKNVLDLCAAPGGKTAALIASGANVTALDRSRQRLDVLQQNLARLKMQAEIVCADAEKWQGGRLYDAILLDAPCSSSGTLRRHPDVAFVKTEPDIHKLAALQKRLLEKAAMLLKPGGSLVYATCSLEPEEGEEQAKAFLTAHPGFSLVPIRSGDLNGFAEPVTERGWLRARPDMLASSGGMDGFFAAKFVKTG